MTRTCRGAPASVVAFLGEGTPARKLDVHRVAFESAMQDAVVTERELAPPRPLLPGGA